MHMHVYMLYIVLLKLSAFPEIDFMENLLSERIKFCSENILLAQ